MSNRKPLVFTKEYLSVILPELPSDDLAQIVRTAQEILSTRAKAEKAQQYISTILSLKENNFFKSNADLGIAINKNLKYSYSSSDLDRLNLLSSREFFQLQKQLKLKPKHIVYATDYKNGAYAIVSFGEKTAYCFYAGICQAHGTWRSGLTYKYSFLFDCDIKQLQEVFDKHGVVLNA